ncbi:MAG: DUF4258 domain-containing protein [Nitrospirae bacterium]|nr:DUF4258 domain-containing protein [Nitrospirota bacterium]
MKIKYSRHAKRRAKLYNISLADIELLLKTSKLLQGKQEFVKSIEGYNLPLTVITVYPLKKGKRK